MKILGIHDGHNSGSTLLIDGKIIASVSEERFTRKKNEIGYPKFSIDEVLSIANLKSKDLDKVVYASNFMHTAEHLSKATDWYKADYEDQIRDQSRDNSYLKAVFARRQADRIQQAVEQLKIPQDKIGFVEHHLAHGAAAYYAAPFDLKEPILILTCDGAGDGVSASVSIGKENKIERIAQTSRKASLGKVYSRVTYALGFKPWEHEYKIMGLAPYADENYAIEIKNILKEHLKLSEDGLNFDLVGKLESSYIYGFLKNKFERKRFDSISGGLQMFTEEILSQWVKNTINYTGINKIVCGGGVFMNVKANKIISELDEVKNMFVFPSCGDESLSIGAVWHEYFRLSDTKAINQRKPLTNVYLGNEFSDEEIRKVLEKNLNQNNFKFSKSENIEKITAELLAENNIVARFSGRMEWGARALGNRSILANPTQWSNVEKINSMIKMRDFWMPFAPSILADDIEKYIENPKNLDSLFMMQAFDSKENKQEKITATTHPRDKTLRAQFVYKEINPSYWNLIKLFQEKTGCSAILNTSFNLHGYPLVNTPEDAIYVFLNSGLDYLAIGSYLVEKN